MNKPTSDLITIKLDPNVNRGFYHDIVDAVFGVYDKYKEHEKTETSVSEIKAAEEEKKPVKKDFPKIDPAAVEAVLSNPSNLGSSQEEKLSTSDESKDNLGHLMMPEKTREAIAATGFSQRKSVACTSVPVKGRSIFRRIEEKTINIINQIAQEPGLSVQEFMYRLSMQLGISIPSRAAHRLVKYINYDFASNRRSKEEVSESYANCAVLVLSGMTCEHASTITRVSVVREDELNSVPASKITNQRLIEFYLAHKEVIDDYIKNHPDKLKLPAIPQEILNQQKEKPSEETSEEVESVTAPVPVKPTKEEVKLTEVKTRVRLQMQHLTAEVITSLCDAYEKVCSETELLGDRAIYKALKVAGFKASRDDAKKVIFGHKFIDNFAYIDTPVYRFQKASTVDHKMIRTISLIKFLRGNGFSIRKISKETGENMVFVEKVYFEIIYTQVGDWVDPTDERIWKIKYLKQVVA